MMGHLSQLFDIVMHMDVYLQSMFQQYGAWSYAILFLIIFLETGLVVTPFLPGDSLLFAAGSLVALSGLNIHLLALLLFIAAVAGDAVNYWIGHYIGPRVFNRQSSRLLNPAHLHRAHDFYEKHGANAIILARFIPIIRTFAPFVAGMARMSYVRFSLYNVMGAFLWIGLLLYSSYYFGRIPLIKENFSVVILCIIVVSLLPPIIEYYRCKGEKSDRGI